MVDPRLIEETLRIWQGRYAQKLNKEQGREIIENITALFDLLAHWDQASPQGSHSSEKFEVLLDQNTTTTDDELVNTAPIIQNLKGGHHDHQS